MEHIYLSHHGIKGQKWGIRRFQLKNGRLTAAGKKRYAEDDDEQKKKGEEESKPKVKPISEMSDEELRAKINRIRLENEYKQYVSGPQQQKTRDGKKFVMDATKRLLLEPAINAGSKAMNDKLNKVLSEYVNGTPKTIKELKEMDVDKMSDKDLTRLATRLNDENRVKESRRVANDKDATLRLLKDTKTEDLTGDQLKSVLDRVTNENKLEKARKGEVTGMSKDEVTELVERLMEEKLNHSYEGDDILGCDHLSHHGIKGQKWGVRRFQNADGSLTAAGKKRQSKQIEKVDKYRKKRVEKAERYEKMYSDNAERFRQQHGQGGDNQLSSLVRAGSGWSASKKALMNTKVTEITTKADIDKISEDAFIKAFMNTTIIYFKD